MKTRFRNPCSTCTLTCNTNTESRDRMYSSNFSKDSPPKKTENHLSRVDSQTATGWKGFRLLVLPPRAPDIGVKTPVITQSLFFCTTPPSEPWSCRRPGQCFGGRGSSAQEVCKRTTSHEELRYREELSGHTTLHMYKCRQMSRS